jgi:hypothetical protein
MEIEIEIKENIILDANFVCCAMGDTNNSFSRVLKMGESLKTKGLNPIYIFNNETMQLRVEIKETYGKKLN